MSGNYYIGMDKKPVDFYVIKGIVEELLDYLGYGGRYSFVVNDEIPEDLHPGKSAIISLNGKNIGFIGRVNPVICNDEVYVAEINMDKLLFNKTGKMKYSEISKFPSVRKDIAIVVDENVTASELQKTIKSAGGKLLIRSEVFDVYQGKGIEEKKKSMAFALELGDSSKTLTDEEINAEVTKITEALSKKHNAELRG